MQIFVFLRRRGDSRSGTHMQGWLLMADSLLSVCLECPGLVASTLVVLTLLFLILREFPFTTALLTSSFAIALVHLGTHTALFFLIVVSLTLTYWFQLRWLILVGKYFFPYVTWSGPGAMNDRKIQQCNYDKDDGNVEASRRSKKRRQGGATEDEDESGRGEDSTPAGGRVGNGRRGERRRSASLGGTTVTGTGKKKSSSSFARPSLTLFPPVTNRAAPSGGGGVVVDAASGKPLLALTIDDVPATFEKFGASHIDQCLEVLDNHGAR